MLSITIGDPLEAGTILLQYNSDISSSEASQQKDAEASDLTFLEPFGIAN